MDGTAVAITCPRLSCCLDPRKYYNRKCFLAISVQACVSASYRVTFFTAMHAGSTHDSTAFLSTSLHSHLSKKEEDDGLSSWTRVATDNAYGKGFAGGRVLTPYAGSVTKRQDSFNCYLSFLRIFVEQVFRVIVCRFGVLWSPMRYTLVKAARIVVVRCKFHNFIIEQRLRREGADICHGAGVPVGSDPDNHVLGAPDVISQDDLHREPEVARHARQGNGSLREGMTEFLALSGLFRLSCRR
jgi:DDE superfamily endonuclease